MPRLPKPFFHRGWWCTNFGGVRTKLASGEENLAAAEEALLELQLQQRKGQLKSYPQLTVSDLCGKFMDTVQVERSRCTYSDYRSGLKKFVQLYGSKRARELTRLLVEEFRGCDR
jgi:hypothetical protein